MKKLVLAAAFAATASTAFAGNVSDPVIEAPVIEAVTETSSSGAALPLVLLAVLLLATAN